MQQNPFAVLEDKWQYGDTALLILDIGSSNVMRSVFIQYFAYIQHCELCG